MSMERYEPSYGKRAKGLLRKARNVNRSRDAIERNHGHAAPGDCPLGVHLRTILEALMAGLEMQDWNCVAEGVAMLQDAEFAVRQVARSQDPEVHRRFVSLMRQDDPGKGLLVLPPETDQ
jgi:hypothetical protein